MHIYIHKQTIKMILQWIKMKKNVDEKDSFACCKVWFSIFVSYIKYEQI